MTDSQTTIEKPIGSLREETWVVVAAFQESRTVGETVRGVREAGWRVLVVDDGSDDDTSGAAARAGAIVLRHVVNRGQGAALQTGIDHAVRRGARFVVTFDADGQHRPADIQDLVDAVAEDTDVALGSRFLGEVIGASRWRYLLLRCAVSVSNLLSGLRLTDAHCGLRAMRVEIVPMLRIRRDRMAHASELLRRIHDAGLRYREVPVTVHYSDYSRAKGQRFYDVVRILFDYFVRG